MLSCHYYIFVTFYNKIIIYNKMSSVVRTKSLIRTKTGNFGEKPDLSDEKKTVETDNDKCVKKINFKKEVDVIQIKSTTEEFNIQVFDKNDERCASCQKCIIF